MNFNTKATNFERLVRKNIKNDREVECKEGQLIQKVVTGMARGISKSFGIGEHWGNKNIDRVKDAVHTLSGVTPILTITPKDHKLVEVGEDPKDRPICEAASS